MKTISIIAIVLISLFSFVFILNYQDLCVDYEYVYAFSPSNAPTTEASSVSENTTSYQFVKS